ncbi:hypothetical protein NFJ02_11g04400 [Pycnococcus provasolii]
MNHDASSLAVQGASLSSDVAFLALHYLSPHIPPHLVQELEQALSSRLPMRRDYTGAAHAVSYDQLAASQQAAAAASGGLNALMCKLVELETARPGGCPRITSLLDYSAASLAKPLSATLANNAITPTNPPLLRRRQPPSSRHATTASVTRHVMERECGGRRRVPLPPAQHTAKSIEPIRFLAGHRDAVYCINFSPTGRFFITGADDGEVKIWCSRTTLLLATCIGHGGDIVDISVSVDESTVSTCANDGSVLSWHLCAGELGTLASRHVHHVKTPTQIVYHPSIPGLFMTSAEDGAVCLWAAGDAGATLAPLSVFDAADVTPGAEPRAHSTKYYYDDPNMPRAAPAPAEAAGRAVPARAAIKLWGVQFDASGRFAVAGASDGTAWMLELGVSEILSGGEHASIGRPRSVRAAALAAETEAREREKGKATAASSSMSPSHHHHHHHHHHRGPSYHGVNQIPADVRANLASSAAALSASGQPAMQLAVVGDLKGHAASIQHVFSAHKTSAVLTVSQDGAVRIWRPHQKCATATAAKGAGGTSSNRPRGKASTSTAAAAASRSWEMAHRLHCDMFPSSPDGVDASAGTANRGANASAGAASRKKPPVPALVWASFTCDDRRVVASASDFSLRIFDAWTGEPQSVLRSHVSDVFVLNTHPWHPHIAISAGYDGVVVMWDVARGVAINQCQPLEVDPSRCAGERNSYLDGQWSPDGSMYICTDGYGQVFVLGDMVLRRLLDASAAHFCQFHKFVQPTATATATGGVAGAESDPNAPDAGAQPPEPPGPPQRVLCMVDGTAYPPSYTNSYARGTLEADGFGEREVVIRPDPLGQSVSSPWSDVADTVAYERSLNHLRTILGGAHGGMMIRYPSHAVAERDAALPRITMRWEMGGGVLAPDALAARNNLVQQTTLIWGNAALLNGAGGAPPTAAGVGVTAAAAAGAGAGASGAAGPSRRTAGAAGGARRAGATRGRQYVIIDDEEEDEDNDIEMEYGDDPEDDEVDELRRTSTARQQRRARRAAATGASQRARRALRTIDDDEGDEDDEEDWNEDGNEDDEDDADLEGLVDEDDIDDEEDEYEDFQLQSGRSRGSRRRRRRRSGAVITSGAAASGEPFVSSRGRTVRVPQRLDYAEDDDDEEEDDDFDDEERMTTRGQEPVSPPVAVPRQPRSARERRPRLLLRLSRDVVAAAASRQREQPATMQVDPRTADGPSSDVPFASTRTGRMPKRPRRLEDDLALEAERREEAAREAALAARAAAQEQAARAAEEAAQQARLAETAAAEEEEREIARRREQSIHARAERADRRKQAEEQEERERQERERRARLPPVRLLRTRRGGGN